MPATTKLPDMTRSPASLAIGSAFAGEQRFVDFEVGLLEDLAVDDDLIARPQLDDVVEHHRAGHQRLRAGLPAHQRFRLSDDGQLVQRLFGALLDDADRAVGDDQQAEGPVDHRTGGQHDDQQHTEDGVDAGEHVGPDDLRYAARRPGRHVVGLACGDSLGDFGIGQPGRTMAVISSECALAEVVVVLQCQPVAVERGPKPFPAARFR